MRISQRAWTQYINALRKINDRAYKAMKDYLDIHGLPTEKWEEDALIDVATAVARKYGEASAAVSAEFYDKIGRMAGRILPAALPADDPTMHEVAKAVIGTAKTGNPDIVAGSVSRLVKQQGVDTTMHNAIRDGAEWAWVPQGETCAFYEAQPSWNETVMCWAWDTQNYTGGNWPGQACQKLGTASNGNTVWKWTYTGTLKTQPTQIIFSNNGAPQTPDLPFQNGGYYNFYGLKGVVTVQK